jgi:hypothetical protein
MQLSRFEALGMIPDKEKVAIYIYRSRRKPGQAPIKRKMILFEDLMRGIPDEISQASLCMVREAERAGALIKIVTASRKFYVKPDAKKMKRSEKLNGIELKWKGVRARVSAKK